MSDTHATHISPSEKLIYESSNGDKWYLCEDPTTSLPAVKHIANTQSGGHLAYLGIESFLSVGEGPEHQALRDLLNRNYSITA
jgi:hypothetical protein